jgi:hypothetical protein
MKSYTLIDYVNPNEYDTNCEEYIEMNKIIEKIYPIEEEREYILHLYSSVLIGKILKDTFFIAYGTGSDGKTTISNMIQRMLGCDGFDNENKLNNPSGLATTMKSETLFHTGIKSSHDEGGAINLIDKAYCSLQEPNIKLGGGLLQTSKIKEMLSGTAMTARKIFCSESKFVVNALLILQTNIIPSFDQLDDATRRRMTIYKYLSKFYNEKTSHKWKKLKYKFEADYTLMNRITSDPKYWDALFQILLKYTLNLLNSNIDQLSKIPIPDSIQRSTTLAFDKSSGLSGWLSTYISQSDYGCLSITLLIDIIINKDKEFNSDRSTLGLVTGKTRNEKEKEIKTILVNTYGGYLYQVREEFLKKHPKNNVLSFSKKSVGENEISATSIYIECKEMEINIIIEKYMDEYPLSELSSSNDSSNNDIFIVGYTLMIDDNLESI